MSTRQLTILPAMPIPPVFDPVERLRHLREILDPNSPSYCRIEGQHENIRAAIAAYEAGEITEKEPGYFKRGKHVTAAEGSKLDTFVWREVCSCE